MLVTSAALLLNVLALLPALQSAPETPTPAPPDAASGASSLPPVEPPPTLKPSQLDELDREIAKLRATNPDALKAAEDNVIACGRGALPQLLKVASTNNVAQMDAIVHCLTVLADMRDRDLVAQSFASPLPVLQRFAARKSGELALPELLDKCPPLLTSKDEGVRLEATLALLKNGREQGLPQAAAAFGGPARPRVVAALPGIAGKGDHQALADMIRIDPQREKEEPEVAAKERLAAVQLLHAIGDKTSQTLLVRALDDKHNVVQREAINALRDLLEHQGPLDKSSIFQQINEVKRLKEVWQKG